MNNKIYGLAFGAFVGSMLLASCSNELTEPTLERVPDGKVSLVKLPEVDAYSGEYYLETAGTRSNGGDGNSGWDLWTQFDVPGNITAEEKAGVLAALQEKVTGYEIDEDLVLPWENYFLQDVLSGTESDTPSKSYDFEAYNKGAYCYHSDGNDYEQVTNNGQISHYYQDYNTNPQTRIDKTALMYDMTVGTYDEMKGKQFRWYINCHENLHWSNYIFVKYEGNYYICFDFACGYPEHDVDGNPGRGSTWHDWDYNDWIVKITPADPKDKDNVWGETPENPDPDQGNGNGDDEEGDVNTPEGPKDPKPIVHNHEVEVNYAILDSHDSEVINSHPYDKADLITKLSIHVRCATNVDLKIPVPTRYVIESDDLYIFNQHNDIEGVAQGVYGGTLEELLPSNANQELSYNVNGNIVTLYVKFVENEEGGYIRVYTEGINQDVIDYCWENYGDGINFEVWNYYQTEEYSWVKDDSTEKGGYGQVTSTTDLTREGLKELLDKTTIEFKENDVLPDYYINAFGCGATDHSGIVEEGYSHECVKHEWHCTVKPVDTVNYPEPAEMQKHLNGTPFNNVYIRNGVEADDAHAANGNTTTW